MQVRFGVQYWPLFLRKGERFVGCCGLRPYDLSKGIFELGVHLLPMFWGKGYAREACARVIRLAFDDLGCPSLFAGHNPRNVASARLLLDLGFIHTHDELYPPTGLEHPSYTLNRDVFYRAFDHLAATLARLKGFWVKVLGQNRSRCSQPPR